MRITNNMINDHFLYNYNNALSNATDLQTQISNGKSINKPSDDPVRAVRALQFHTSSDMNDVFSQSANDAVSWMTTSDGAMMNMADSMRRVKELTVRAVSPNPSMAFQASATEVDGLIQEMVDLANTQIGGRYVFAGQNDHTQPYSYDSTTNVVTYNGTYDTQGGNSTAGTIAMKVSPGAPDPVRDKVNVDGLQLFGAGTTGAAADPTAVLKTLVQIKTDMQAGNTTALTSDLTALESSYDSVISAQTSLGSRQAVYETIQSRLVSDKTVITSDLSKNEDLDMAKASIDFQSAQNTYNAALSVGARLLPQSLVDYLK